MEDMFVLLLTSQNRAGQGDGTRKARNLHVGGVDVTTVLGSCSEDFGIRDTGTSLL